MMKKRRKVSKKKQAKKNFKAKLRKAIRKNLTKHLNWNLRFANFASTLIVGLISIVAGVWQKKLALAIGGEKQNDSNTKAVQRFLCNAYLNYGLYSQMLYTMLQIKEKVIVVIDRTNWDFGKKHINIFVAAILVKSFHGSQSFVVPVVWEVYDKKGISNTEERKRLMNKVIALVGIQNIEMILADREFIGEEWIQYLYKNTIPFVIRVRNNMYVEHEGKEVKICNLFADVKYKEKLSYSVKIDGVDVTLVGTRSVEGELVVAIASGVAGDPLNEYRLRWLIELFFKSIKSRSFNIEETHMTDPERIKLLFALISYATVLAVQAGRVRDHHKKIMRKNHGRPTYSLFTYGLDLLRDLFCGVIPKYLIDFFNLNPAICNFHDLSLLENVQIYALSDG